MSELTIEELLRGQWSWRISEPDGQTINGTRFDSRREAIMEAIESGDYFGYDGDFDCVFGTCLVQDETVRLSKLIDWDCWLHDVFCEHGAVEKISESLDEWQMKFQMQEVVCDKYDGLIMEFAEPEELLPELNPVALASLGREIREAMDAYQTGLEIPKSGKVTPAATEKIGMESFDFYVSEAIDRWQLRHGLRFVQAIYMNVERQEEHAVAGLFGAERRGRRSRHFLGWVDLEAAIGWRQSRCCGCDPFTYPHHAWLSSDFGQCESSTTDGALGHCKIELHGLFRHFPSLHGFGSLCLLRPNYDRRGEPPSDIEALWHLIAPLPLNVDDPGFIHGSRIIRDFLHDEPIPCAPGGSR